MSTKIEWADKTINPVVGCSKCSPGCDNCYAERFAARLAKNPDSAAKYRGTVDQSGHWTGKINGLWMSNTPSPSDRKSKRIFMGSMGDMFHENVTTDLLVKMLAFAAVCRQHTFILLTKRPERMLQFMSDTSSIANDRRVKAYKDIASIYGVDTDMDDLGWPLNNLWLGVTVCNQAEADEKIPILLRTPAVKRFVSLEPLLGPVDLGRLHCTGYECPDVHFVFDCLTGRSENADWVYHGENTLDWVICGGETGPCARPMHPSWARTLRDQCVAARVPFFFKGWGEWYPEGWVHYDSRFDHPYMVLTLDGRIVPNREALAPSHNVELRRLGKRRSGRLLDKREWNEMPS